MSRLLLACAILSILAGCSKPTVSGDAFVIKGDGTVVPSSGRTVFFLPYSDELEFVHGVVQAAHLMTLEEVAPSVLELCESARSVVAQRLERNIDAIQEGESADTYPENGCGKFVTEEESLGAEVAALRQEHEHRLSGLRADVAKARADKSTAVTEEKRKTEARIDALVNTSVERQQAYTVTFTLTNATDFCLASPLRYQLLANSDEVASTQNYDNYRYPSGGSVPCFLPSGESRQVVSVALLLRYDSNRTTDYPEVTKIIIKPSFVRLSTTSSPKIIGTIDLKEATASVLLSPEYNDKIEAAEKAVQDEVDRFHSLAALTELNRKTRQRSSCEAGMRAVDKLKSRRAILSQLDDDLSECDNERPGFFVVQDAAKRLNEDFEQQFELPNYLGILQTNVHATAVSNFAGQKVLKADTTISGSYAIAEVTKGTYLVFSEYADNFVNGFWLFPVNIDRDMRVDLNMSNFLSHGLSDYLSYHAEHMCKSCPIEDAEMTARYELDAKLTEIEKGRGELNESLRRLQRLLDQAE